MTQIDKFFNLSSSMQAFIGRRSGVIGLFTTSAYSIISIVILVFIIKYEPLLIGFTSAI